MAWLRIWLVVPQYDPTCIIHSANTTFTTFTFERTLYADDDNNIADHLRKNKSIMAVQNEEFDVDVEFEAEIATKGFVFEVNKRQDIGIKRAFDRLRQGVENGFEQVNKRFKQVNERFDQVDERFDQVDKRFKQVEGRFKQIDARFEQVEERFKHVDKRFEQVDEQFKRVYERFDHVDTQIAANSAQIATNSTQIATNSTHLQRMSVLIMNLTAKTENARLENSMDIIRVVKDLNGAEPQAHKLPDRLLGLARLSQPRRGA